MKWVVEVYNHSRQAKILSLETQQAVALLLPKITAINFWLSDIYF